MTEAQFGRSSTPYGEDSADSQCLRYAPPNQVLQPVALKMSCFGFKSKKEKSEGKLASRKENPEISRCNDSFSDMVDSRPGNNARTSMAKNARHHAKTPKARTAARQEQRNRRSIVQDDHSEDSDTSNNASMHDSGSSFKEAGIPRDRLPEHQAAKKGVQAVENTSEEGSDEDCEEPVLLPEWQINPLDIYFCSKKNHKLVKLGKGGFGTVYKGVWKGRTVAVKVCRQQHLTAKAMKQFQTEVAILNSCSHENIVEFIGACCWKGGKRTVLVTEFLEKGDLCTALGKAPHLYAWDNLGRKVALDVARGLAFLHSHNVVHFDLKSANILLDKHSRAKLADVGLAKTLTDYHGEDQLSTVLATGDLGTFAWAAPEVLLGFSCNCKADIFSFGVLMWELATGEMPSGRCLRPLRVPEEAPQQAANLIMDCLRHDPAMRPSAEDLLETLEGLQ